MKWTTGAWVGGLAEWTDEETRTAYLSVALYATFAEYRRSAHTARDATYDAQQGLFT